MERWGAATTKLRGFPGGASGGASANAEDIKDESLIPEWGRSPEGGHGNPLQDSSLENPMDTGAWGATVYWVTESNTTEVT